MQVENELAEIAPEKDMLLTIGVFDGVHRGHQYLLSRLKERAVQQDLLSGVITFRQHPRAVLAARNELPYITSLEEKVSLIKKEGIDKVIILSFTKELSQLSARQFVELLKRYLRVRGFLLGADFALGRKREGDIAALTRLGQEMGFGVETITPVKSGDQVVSSTVIREALAHGDIEKTSSLVGRHFSLSGRVMKGEGRGVALGFPTANLDVDTHQLLPPDGVYATLTQVGEKTYQSVTNVGKNPTFGANKRTVEAYLLDFQGNLYGRILKIEFIERLRGEKKFKSAENLKKQMTVDVEQGRTILEALTAKTADR